MSTVPCEGMLTPPPCSVGFISPEFYSPSSPSLPHPHLPSPPPSARWWSPIGVQRGRCLWPAASTAGSTTCPWQPTPPPTSPTSTAAGKPRLCLEKHSSLLSNSDGASVLLCCCPVVLLCCCDAVMRLSCIAMPSVMAPHCVVVLSSFRIFDRE